MRRRCPKPAIHQSTTFALALMGWGCATKVEPISQSAEATDGSTTSVSGANSASSGETTTADTDCEGTSLEPPEAFDEDLWRIVNAIHDGETLSYEYSGKPRYHTLQLRAHPGDHLRIELSVERGNPRAWLLDRESLQELATASPSCDENATSVIDIDLPDRTAGDAAVRSVHFLYLVTAERDAQATSFTVALDGGAPVRALDEYEQLFVDYWRPQPRPPEAEWNVTTATYEIFSTASAYRRALEGTAFEPEQRAAWLEHMRFAGDGLVDAMSHWRDVGWGVLYSWDAYQDGSVNPKDTVYSYQTGTAIWALAELYDLTRRSTYLEAAETAMGHYHEKAFKSEGLGACSSCGYYLYSDHPNDADRGVKNTNLEIGLAGIVLDHYAPQTSWYEPAIAATEYHMVEVRDFFNYSYLSLWDPHYFPGAGLWDVHNSIEAWYLLRAGEITGRQDFIDAAIQHYKAYEPHAPDIWEQRLMSCHFAPYVDAAHQVCTTWIVEHGGAASDKALGLVMRY